MVATGLAGNNGDRRTRAAGGCSRGDSDASTSIRSRSNSSTIRIPCRRCCARPARWCISHKWNVYGVARYAEVHAVLNDPATFCSSRGVGLSDFAKEKPWRPPSLILEADPPAHTRTRAVLSKVLSPAVMKQIRDRFAAAAEAKVDELLAKRQLRRRRRSRRGLSAVGVSRRDGPASRRAANI